MPETKLEGAKPCPLCPGTMTKIRATSEPERGRGMDFEAPPDHHEYWRCECGHEEPA